MPISIKEIEQRPLMTTHWRSNDALLAILSRWIKGLHLERVPPPIEIIDESDDEVISSTQCEDPQVILDHMGLTPPLNKGKIASHGS